MTPLAKRLNPAQLMIGLRARRGDADFFLSATGNTRIQRLGAA
jgi:hypothetical protein